LTVSDTRTLATDKSGDTLAEFVGTAGHVLVARDIVVDDERSITQSIASSIEKCDVLLITGGTGLTARDVTPDALRPLITKEIPGFGELFRFLSYYDVGTATIQSRALGALCGRALVFALPGSTGAIRLAIDGILRPQLDVRTKPCNFAELLPRIRGEKI
jgi:molybdenum cofactor biosynthesis protein B